MCSHLTQGCDDDSKASPPDVTTLTGGSPPETLGHSRPYGPRTRQLSHSDSGLPMKSFCSGLLLLSVMVPTAAIQAQARADSAAIRATALDYSEGWYEGNGDRMARALHPELVKRIVVRDTTTGKTMVQGMGASVLVNSTRHGYGKETPKDKQQKDVTVLDVFGNAASAKVVMADWIDYMQLAKVDGRWLIVTFFGS